MQIIAVLRTVKLVERAINSNKLTCGRGLSFNCDFWDRIYFFLVLFMSKCKSELCFPEHLRHKCFDLQFDAVWSELKQLMHIPLDFIN